MGVPNPTDGAFAADVLPTTSATRQAPTRAARALVIPPPSVWATETPSREPRETKRLAHRSGQRRAAALDRFLRALTSFQASPVLRVLDEPAQPFQQDAGGGALALERLDPVEPGQHCAGLVHVDDASPRRRACL